MDFLLDYEISGKTIDNLEKNYEESTIDIFKLEKDNVIEVIKYFKKIGIKNIEDLLLYNITLFTKDIETLKKAFNKHDIMEFVYKINEDITNINKL